MIAVGLDGQAIPLRRVRRRVRTELRASNVGQDNPTLVQAQEDEEWAAYDELPMLIREYLREVMPIDQSTSLVLDQWRRAARQGASPGTFVRYLEDVSLRYLQQTASVWPTPPLPLTRVPRYDPPRKRKKYTLADNSRTPRLTDEEVDAIRTRYAAGGTSHAKLAREFNVHESYIGLLLKNKRRT